MNGEGAHSPENAKSAVFVCLKTLESVLYNLSF